MEASLKGDSERAFEKLGSNVAQVKADNIAGAVAARWLALSPEALAENYASGDVVAFHCPYKRLGVKKGDERRVVDVDRQNPAGDTRREGRR